ncbi:hypothetical protein DSM106972_010680 [Dulcicalothrix desertica PCC 7102]|uniref:Type I restriction enzyme R protein N-terminal domain-containing protein n=1 Tax=Dulcicalothrix desertica PCC 7102 TaxID=232991 RepID=A0A3S1CJZ8_9CYAN|nr:hypothetical protein [Dulcicalothrix desertica]RUT09015.1 hypothetical protein DSM106972_010680 [Dulcicalothrix desertica PCC 7102]TWH49899.1 hypothetical protein CAL7102_04159 [Dulcicalothrix desertica PCC 7102]
MSFESYRNIAQVLQEFNITSSEASFLVETKFDIRETFREELSFSLREFTFEDSEYAICEAVVFPILREVYRNYRENFTLWSHKTLTYDVNLTGIPDYILANKSPLGKEVFEKPFLIAVEAKRDDFIKGWGQCLAEMVAIQKINQNLEQDIYGIVSNGQFWQFGKLKGNIYTREIKSYTLSDIDKLFAALNYIFMQCQRALDLFNRELTI